MFNDLSRPPGLRATQKQATADAVLEAARAEFERVGFEAANLRAIAARAKVSAGTVIHHYGDKRELLHAALFDDLDRTIRRALTHLGDGPLEAQLTRLSEAVFGYYQARPNLSRTLLKESLFAEESWAAKFADQVRMLHGELAKLIAQAKARGELANEANAPLLAVAWFSFFYFGLISWVQGAHPTPVALVSALTAQHLSGMRPSHEPNPKSPNPKSKSPRRSPR